MRTEITRPLDRPSLFTGVGVDVTGNGTITVTQPVGPRFYDHRGRTTIGSMGVLTDIAVGYPAGLARQLATGIHTQGVLAQLSASTADTFPQTGSVSGTARSLHFDDAVGLSAAEIRDDDGRLVLHLTGRSMVVGRVPIDAATAQPAEQRSVPEPEAWADSDLLASRSGLDIVAGIADGSIPRGPLAGVLGMRVDAAARGTIEGALAPAEWTANPIGSIQGGVLVSIVDVASSLAAQTLTAPGQEYRTLQLTVDYLRSPAVPGPDVLVRSKVTRAGRRLASVDTALTAADGTVFVRASTSVQLMAAA
ncbi:hotdog fold thioesterase [Rhodococcus yananensis]|uniref:PaaI family thioesterase n=1 Tax=Rhodococcus yananensis TaxID=2879464 RepID=UPI003EBF5937